MAVLGSGAAMAEPIGPEPIGDLNTSPVYYSDGGYGASLLRSVGDRLYFIGVSPSRGAELWTSDGTAGGTVPLRAISGGTLAGLSGFSRGSTHTFFFADWVGTNPSTLWCTNDRWEGTVPVPFPGNIVPRKDYCLLGNRLFTVTLNSNTAKQELWQTDGSAAGTKRIMHGAAASAVYPLRLRTGPDGVYYAQDTTVGKLPSAPPDASAIMLPIDLSDSNFFLFPDSTSILCLNSTNRFRRYALNGSPLADAFDMEFAAAGPWHAFVGGTVFFPGRTAEDANPALYRTDGVAGTTVRVASFDGFPAGTTLDSGQEVGGRVYFVVNPPTGDDEVWSSDGSPEGTRRAEAISSMGPTIVRHVLPAPPGVVVEASSQVSGPRRWWYTAGDPNSGFSLPDATAMVGGGFLPGGVLATNGSTIYRAAAPYFQFRALEVLGHGTGSSRPSGFQAWKGGVLFSATDASGKRKSFWSDGSAAPVLATEFETTAGMLYDAGPMKAFGDRFLFAASRPDTGEELWSIPADGSASAELVADLAAGPRGSQPAELTAYNGELFFLAGGSVGKRSMYRTDGTAAGTQLLHHFTAGRVDGDPRDLHVLGDKLRVVAAVDGADYEIWESSAENLVPRRVFDPLVSEQSGLRHLRQMGQNYYFLRRGQYPRYHQWELVSTDVALGGASTHLHYPSTYLTANLSAPRFVEDVNFYTSGGSSYQLVAAMPTTSSSYRNVYVAASSTFTGGVPGPLAAVALSKGGKLMALHKAATGISAVLWTDGVPAHHQQILGNGEPFLTTAGESLKPVAFLPYKGYVFFGGQTLSTGYGVWRTDGTSAGTVRLGPTPLGAMGSHVASLTIAGEYLCFSARMSDGVTADYGWEPYIVPLADVLPAQAMEVAE